MLLQALVSAFLHLVTFCVNCTTYSILGHYKMSELIEQIKGTPG